MFFVQCFFRSLEFRGLKVGVKRHFRQIAAPSCWDNHLGLGFGVWGSVFGVWCLVFGFWFSGFGVLSLGVLGLACGIESLGIRG